MLARKYPSDSIASAPLNEWIAFLHELARGAFAVVRPGGYLALLLAPQTEKDLPAGYGYLDHSFLGYIAAARAGFMPERRISCPMDGGYLPQQVRQARAEGECWGRCAISWSSAGHCMFRDGHPPSSRICTEFSWTLSMRLVGSGRNPAHDYPVNGIMLSLAAIEQCHNGTCQDDLPA